MKHITRNTLVTAFALAGLSAQSYAGASLTSGPIALGVNDEGHLNFDDPVVDTVNGNSGRLGLAIQDAAGRYLDGTAPATMAEGWGASANGVSGSANVDIGGVSNLTLDSFASSATEITSVTTVTGLGLEVSQVYAPSVEAPTQVFENQVTMTNNSAVTLNDVRYARAMDWDIAPSEFSEFVTIVGTATTTLLETSHDNGFAATDPLDPSAFGAPFAGAPLDPATLDVDFIDNGPADHGAYFLFNFGTLEPGESVEFSVFYGATYSERSALLALNAVGAELFSLGQSSGDPITGTPYTYMFGFEGVGGVVIPVPEPSAAGLLGFGLIGVVIGLRRRRR